MVPVSRIGKTEKDLIVKNGDKFINNEDYLSVFYKTILSDNVVENYYSALKNVAYSKWLSKVLPEILYASLQPQNTPWHVYNVLDHILHTVKHVNALSKDLNYNARKMLALSAFFHDLGKPDCATKKEVDGTVYDTFKGHVRRSVEIFNKSFKHFNLDAREWELITFLIKNHDFLMDLKIYNVDKIDKNVVKKELFKDFNYDESEKDAYFLFLITLTLADNMAQNLDLTHKNVEFLGALLKEIKI